MKKRTISAAVILVVTFLALFSSKNIFGIFLVICGILGTKELLSTKFAKKRLEFISFISYLLIFFLITNKWLFNFDLLALIIMTIIVLVIPVIFYNDNDKYSIIDASYMSLMVLILGLALNSLLLFRIENIYLALLVYIICYVTDTYAYLGGSLIGKTKLTSISPKKTWEGSIIASLVGTFLGTLYINAFLSSDSLILSIIISFLLTLVCQFGDLVFSSIKRYFKIKDFSNLIPGHGGMLDRLDSVIFVSLMLMVLRNLL